MIDKKDLKLGTIIEYLAPNGDKKYAIISKLSKGQGGATIFGLRDLIDDIRHFSHFESKLSDRGWGFGEGLINREVQRIVPQDEVAGKRISYTNIIIEKGKKIDLSKLEKRSSLY